MILRVTIQKQNSEQLLPKVSTEAFCKIDFLKNVPVGKHLCWTLFLIKLLAKRQATILKRDSNAGIFLTIAKFLRADFFIEHLRWLFLFVWWSHCSVLGICRHSLLNQNTMCDGFYWKGFQIRPEYLLYILLVETIPIRFCWLTFKKQKLVQSKKIEVRAICSKIKILTV